MSGIRVSPNAVELRPVAGTQSSAARDLIDAERGAAVAAVDIVRTFRGRTALAGASLRVARGEIHALLGPNGAGKTTLLRIIGGLTAPTSGQLRVLDHEIAPGDRELKKVVGVVPAGDRSFYLRLSAIENLVFFARLHGFRRKDAEHRALTLLERVGLGNDGRIRVGEYSQGMKKRLAIARALLPRPLVLLVDEATHDLDPVGAASIRGLVGGLSAAGSAVVWATQRVEEVQGFADGVTVLQEGRVRFRGSVDDLVAQGCVSRYVLRLRTATGAPLEHEAVARALGETAVVDPPSGSSRERLVLSLGDQAGLGAALARLLDAGFDIVSCQHERPDIEHAFLVVTGHRP